MTLRRAVSRALADGVGHVQDLLTAHLQSEARERGVPATEVESLGVRFVDGAFEAYSDSEDFLEREYGRPGSPPLALLRQFNNKITEMATPLLDKYVGAQLKRDGVL